MKVLLNNLLSDHLIILSYRLSDNLIIKKILKQLYQERKSTFGYILQKETFETQVTNFWRITYCRFIETYVVSYVTSNLKGMLSYESIVSILFECN